MEYKNNTINLLTNTDNFSLIVSLLFFSIMSTKNLREQSAHSKLLIIFCAILFSTASLLPVSAQGIADTSRTSPKAEAKHYVRVGHNDDQWFDEKVKLRSSDAPRTTKRFYCYDTYDSVKLLLGRHGRHYCYSTKTGILSKPYLHLGRKGTGTGAGSNLIACVDKDKKMGFINCHTGDEVIPCQFYYNEDVYYEECSPYFVNDKCLLEISLDYDCIIDTTGNILLKDYNIYVSDYYDGYIVVNNEHKESLYSQDLRCLLKDKENISVYKIGIVYTDSLFATPILTNFKFTESVPVYPIIGITECKTYLETHSDPTDESKEMYYSFDIDYELGEGVIDKDMNLVFDPKWGWDKVVYLGNGYFMAYTNDRETAFIMDKKGNFIVPKPTFSPSHILSK